LAALGANLKTPDINGFTPVYVAAQQGHISVIKVLIEGGVDIDAMVGNGYTPLFMAAKKGHMAVIKILIKFGANLNVSNTQGVTHVLVAAYKRHTDVIEFMYKKAWREPINMKRAG
jgi:ankyrin repeat protein